MQQCTAFLENWMTALGNKEFVLLLHTYAKYNSALHHFYLPQTGAYRMIQIDSIECSGWSYECNCKKDSGKAEEAPELLGSTEMV